MYLVGETLNYCVITRMLHNNSSTLYFTHLYVLSISQDRDDEIVTQVVARLCPDAANRRHIKTMSNLSAFDLFPSVTLFRHVRVNSETQLVRTDTKQSILRVCNIQYLRLLSTHNIYRATDIVG